MSTKSPEIELIEQAARDAHASGLTWELFWYRNSQAVVALGLDRDGYQAMLRKLTAIIAAGDIDGTTAAGDSEPPMVIDEPPMVPVISDTETAARLQLNFQNPYLRPLCQPKAILP